MLVKRTCGLTIEKMKACMRTDASGGKYVKKERFSPQWDEISVG